MKPILLLGYDTEYYGRKAASEQEAQENRDHCVRSVKALIDIHRDLKAPCTFFLLGKLIELEPRLVHLLQDTDFDVQSHMYSHTLVKKVQYRDGEVMELVQFRDEIVRTKKIIQREFGKVSTGIRFPYRYRHGMQGDNDHLNILKEEKISYISSDAPEESQTNENAFLENSLQPYHYINGVFEIPLNGLFDTTFIQNKFSRKFTLEQMQTKYLNELEYANQNNLVYTPAFHPWALGYLDPIMCIVRSLIERAKKLNISVMSYSDYYKYIKNKDLQKK